MMQELEKLLNIADQVSDYIQNNYFSSQAKFLKQYDHTNVSGDLQKGIDEIVNQKIIDLLKLAELPIVIISEEIGTIYLTDNPKYFLVLDPIDGSNNVQPWFTPHPQLTISMGMGLLERLQKFGLEAIDITVTREIFTNNIYYSTNQGAYFQNATIKHKLQVSKSTSIIDIPVVGLDLDKKTQCEDYLSKLIAQNIIVRRLGSTILDLCQVASGQYDAYLSMGRRLKLTDICQPYSLVRAAGGFIKVEPYFEGKVFKENFLWESISNNDLLSKIRFNIIAAGTEKLVAEIEKIIIQD